MSAVYTWQGAKIPPRVLRYEGLSLKGVIENPELPGFCTYYGMRPRIYAIAADMRRAMEKKANAIEIILHTRFYMTAKHDQGRLSASSAQGELLDLRSSRVSAWVIEQLRQHFQTEHPLKLLSKHPSRARELVPLFPQVKAFIWWVDSKDRLPLPICWLVSPSPILEIYALHAPQMKVKLPPSSWKCWLR